MSSAVDRSAIRLATGPSLVLSTVSAKLAATGTPEPSVAVTVTVAVPTSSLPGVPDSCPLAGSTVSQAGPSTV